MKTRNEKHERRVKKMILGCGICGIILIASTYAWFIGMKTVNVNAFDVKIAAIDGLSLSLNGKDWADTVAIDETTYKDESVVYAGNTNTWSKGGLIPMSSVGVINPTSSRLTMFEKGSFTQVTGGYRVMATEVRNTDTTKTGEDAEAKGYVAFDLFIKNLSGNEYYADLNKLNEEAIYLTPDSSVTVAENGGVANTGIENSVRVGFAQIGRVIATTEDQSTITVLTCAGKDNTDKSKATGICESRPAQIWEPNDTKHVQNAINWYETNCLPRTGADVTKSDSYTTTEGAACTKVADGNAYPTYAISGTINHTDNINLYDGKEYNGYETSIATEATTGKLVSYPYFTDTMKDIKGVARPELISLAPNSITKVRVYIWIEGQDVDNYDFASLGKKISVNFGFSKEQLYGEDINYTGDPALDPNVQSREPATTPEP